jgi:hypothetical protein
MQIECEEGDLKRDSLQATENAEDSQDSASSLGDEDPGEKPPK